MQQSQAPHARTPATLVLGIGNTLLSDEGVGIHVVDYLWRHHPHAPGVTYLDGGTLSFTLAGPIEDAEHLIVVDAAELKAPPGTVRTLEGEAMDRYLRGKRRSVHEVSLTDLMDIARLTGTLPARRALVGVQPAVVDWGEQPSAAVGAAVEVAARQVLDLLGNWASISK